MDCLQTVPVIWRSYNYGIEVLSFEHPAVIPKECRPLSGYPLHISRPTFEDLTINITQRCTMDTIHPKHILKSPKTHRSAGDQTYIQWVWGGSFTIEERQL